MTQLPKLDPLEKHFSISSPIDGLKLFLRYLPDTNCVIARFASSATTECRIAGKHRNFIRRLKEADVPMAKNPEATIRRNLKELTNGPVAHCNKAIRSKQ
jgi:hypothetical protein